MRNQHDFLRKSTILVLLIFGVLFSGYSQNHKITISPNNYVASLEMTTENYDYLIANNATVLWDSLKNFSKDIYTKFNDDFDFVIYLFNASNDDLRAQFGFYGQTSLVSNSVQGIGLGAFDNTVAYGSSGRLKSAIVLTRNTNILNGPTLHEICHTWANYGIPSKWWDGSQEIPYYAHWGFTGGSTKGQLGGFQQNTLQTNIDGNPNKYSVSSFGGFANGGNSVPYNQLELYLMGMVPITNVPNFDVFSGITQAGVAGSNITFTAATRTTYDNAKLEQVLGGPRIPSSSSSQKNFRTLFVVITPSPLTEADWSFLDYHSQKFGTPGDDGLPAYYNFWEATNGIGTMQTGDLLSSVLPVRFGKIEAKIQNGKLRVNWQTMEESNNDHFIVEASKDGVHFYPGETVATKAVDGNSDTALYYSIEKDIYGLQLGNPVIAVVIVVFGMLFSILMRSKKSRSILWYIPVLFLSVLFFTQCSRAYNDVDVDGNGKLFVRIMQVDKDGTKHYSKVIRVVQQ
ncbi:hypothetical protein [Niabella aquatica]